jgi:hypothetical protein
LAQAISHACERRVDAHHDQIARLGFRSTRGAVEAARRRLDALLRDVDRLKARADRGSARLHRHGRRPQKAPSHAPA